mmetsp:Transcript_38277/g.119505  ORF Transcript_38277/g.119505 Transcript_38277/m.119505 type:complete len:300 (+) Transcript_38277:828-1727(+)
MESGANARRLAQGACERHGTLLEEDDVGLNILLLEDFDGESSLVRAQGPTQRDFHDLPGVRRDGVQHVHQSRVKYGATQGLQWHADRLLTFSDGWIFCPGDLAEERTGAHLLRAPSLGRHLELILEHEGLPCSPPSHDVRQWGRVVADDRWTARLLAAGQVDGICQPVRHGRKPLRPNLLVLHKPANDVPLGEVREPGLPRLRDAGPPLRSHEGGELFEEGVRENRGDLHILIAGGLVDEGLHVLHQPEVLGVVVCHPILERIVVDSGNIPSDTCNIAITHGNPDTPRSMSTRWSDPRR